MYSKLVKMLDIKQMFVLSNKVQNLICVLILYLMKETVIVLTLVWISRPAGAGTFCFVTCF